MGREARSCLQKLGGGIPGNVAAEPGLNCKYKSKLCIGSMVFKLKKMCSVSAFDFLGSDVVVTSGRRTIYFTELLTKKKTDGEKRENYNFLLYVGLLLLTVWIECNFVKLEWTLMCYDAICWCIWML